MPKQNSPSGCAWTLAHGRPHRNGLTPESLEITGVAGCYVRHFMNRKAVLGKRFRAQNLDPVRQLLAHRGGWMVIASKDDTAAALVDAGRRCERMWLQSRAYSIAVHPKSQALEESPFKEQTARDLGFQVSCSSYSSSDTAGLTIAGLGEFTTVNCPGCIDTRTSSARNRRPIARSSGAKFVPPLEQDDRT